MITPQTKGVLSAVDAWYMFCWSFIGKTNQVMSLTNQNRVN